MSSKTGTEVMFETYDKLQTLGQLREELFPCLLEGGLLEQINAQRKEAADEIERLKKEVEWHEEENHRLRDLLHDVSGALFCWEPVSEQGAKHKEELTAKLDAMFGEGK